VILRQAHVDALARVARETFVDRMVVHVEDAFPEQYAARGETGTRELVERGLDAANDVAITTEAGVCSYVELWLTYGVMCDRNGVDMLLVLDDGSLSEDDKLEQLEVLVRGAPDGQG
jgi:hypothetical protein